MCNAQVPGALIPALDNGEDERSSLINPVVEALYNQLSMPMPREDAATAALIRLVGSFFTFG